ncbi:Xaa-Pro peptidase family protein [Corynebacterium sp. HMSC036D02]|uniref:M24 family metallopeptidase n=1 Tax=Corynebacterium sp. HMSC036D02 TaxID=1715013 RepID=UPI0008A88436|nr:Xaa-Pro peptidase family protein [Corynebacterium sp. HMSC036D02]OHO62042.1 peptidase M24 [Corynebacterium sp. HMSC036D02]
MTDYASRLDRARAIAAAKGIDVLLVGTGAEFAYLTGSWISSHERLTCLVIRPDAQPIIVAPSTDIESLQGVATQLVGWHDGQDPYALALEGVSLSTVALGSSLTADHVLRFQSAVRDQLVPSSPSSTSSTEVPQVEYLLATEALAELFSRKDSDEVAELRAAAEAIDAVHAEVPRLLKPGRTEAEVAADLRELILREHDAVDFIIVGSGPNGANPHYDYGDRELGAGDPVVVDIGGTLASGYHSDCTRTYVVGADPSAAPADFQEAYAVLEKAQAAGRAAARPGTTAQEIDRATRSVIEAAGWGEYFTHRTGHGIGLSTHEEPFIMEGNELELSPSMAFSIEPGIYVPGKWGMRLEDIVVTTESGHESLNQAPRGLR